VRTSDLRNHPDLASFCRAWSRQGRDDCSWFIFLVLFLLFPFLRKFNYLSDLKFVPEMLSFLPEMLNPLDTSNSWRPHALAARYHPLLRLCESSIE
jgi:hypothetical protein